MALPEPLLREDSLPPTLDGPRTLRQIADMLNETTHHVEFIRPGELVIDREVRTLREIADELLETHRVEYVRDGELIFVPPPGTTHYRILRFLVKSFTRAFPDLTDVDWEPGENYQWDFLDGLGRYFIPDLVVATPGGSTRSRIRAGIRLVAEVTSPKSRETVQNDHGLKPKRYARGGVPLYLLVDQELGTWTLHRLIDGWPKYQVHAAGRYGKDGDPIVLPEPFGFSIPTDEWPLYSPDFPDGE